MTVAEFVDRATWLPWKRWCSDWSAVDCFGLVVLWHREILGIELGPVPQTDIATGFSAAAGWVECQPRAGATCFMAWHDGAPAHCGVMLSPREVLHAQGSTEAGGRVRVTSLPVMARLYPDIRFYRYARC